MKYLPPLFGLLLVPTLGIAAPPFQASYAVSVNGITLGKMEATLSYQGDHYTYQKLTKANGLAAMLSGDTLTERSTGLRQGERFVPKTYLQHHQNKRKDRRDSFSITPNGRVQGQYNGKPYEFDAPTNALDFAALEIQLMDDLTQGKPLHYQVVSRGKAKTVTFNKLGKEMVETPEGRYQCEKVQHNADNGALQTTVWLAPELDFRIVRITHRDDGETIEANLTRNQPR